MYQISQKPLYLLLVLAVIFLTACSSLDGIFPEDSKPKPPSKITLEQQNGVLFKANLSWEANDFDSKEILYFKKLRASTWRKTPVQSSGYAEALWLDTNSTYLTFARNFNSSGKYKDTDTIEFNTIIAPNFLPKGNAEIEIGRQDGELDEMPKWKNTIRKLFISKYEVTQGLWNEVSTIEKLYNCEFCPANRVSWYEAVLFANEYSKYYGLDTSYTYSEVKYNETDDIILENIKFDPTVVGFRLPIESEWEYLAEGKSGNVVFRDTNSINQSARWGSASYQEVGKSKPNKLGLYDTIGNLWEWVYDGYNQYPIAPQEGYFSRNPEFKVQRGGSFRETEFKYFTSTNRSRLVPTYANESSGFRLVINNPL